MAAFVVLAIALLAVAIGMVLVAGLVLRRQVRGLLHALEEAGSRLNVIATELADEAAVTSLEVESLTERMGESRESDAATAPRR